MTSQSCKTKKAEALDLSYYRSSAVLIGDVTAVELYLIGCGGTGSWLAPSLARVARVLQDERQVDVRLTFIDPDIVESANTFRQNFCEAEIGRLKAETLALRYGMAWGLEIQVVPRRFDQSLVRHFYGTERSVSLLVGCVDNTAARREIAETLPLRGSDDTNRCPNLWWLDCGNGWASGQVLLGAARQPKQLARAFDLPKKCSTLPAPSLQKPDLLQIRPEETRDHQLSCEEIIALNAQSLTVNQMTASIAADYVVSLLLSQDLRCFATHFDLASKSARSKYITPEAVAAAVHETPEKLFAKRSSRRKPSR